jgi:HAE1 family hydrophobic/amphiphilic exporter-1
MERYASHLPLGFAFEWSGISLEEVESGGAAALIFALGIVFVFLVLAAQYESFADPLIILLAVPLALLGAFIGLHLRGFVSDIFSQVGYVMLIGLASKNAILIVEFANQLRASGVPIPEAAQRAAETRLRPILMTSIAFVFGVTPLVFATGAGSAARNSLGTVVFGGMICSSILNLYVTPTLYVIIATLEDKFRPTRHGPASTDSDNGVPAGTTAKPVTI